MATYLGTGTSSVYAIEGDSAYVLAGVYGKNTSASAGASGGYFTSTSGYGVNAVGSSSGYPGVYGQNTAGGYGVWGESDSTNGIGVYGSSSASNGIGTEGVATGSDCSGVEALGLNDAYGWGLYGKGGASSSASHAYGVYGTTTGTTANGCYAGYFNGSVSKSGGSFLIDHPLDPANKYLEHSFVESPDRKNVYDGVGVADSAGELVVQMPDYFEALNNDFRYQLTPLGAAAPNLHVKEELRNGRFVVAGAAPSQRICWQLTGIRKDPWAVTNTLVVERDKPGREKGRYKHPEVYGRPESEGIHWNRAPRPVRAPGGGTPKQP